MSCRRKEGRKYMEENWGGEALGRQRQMKRLGC
jgi:hypothetical protein